MAITFFGEAGVPADGASATNTATQNTITPPASMAAGDLVYVRCWQRSTSCTFSVGVTGGQSWTSTASVAGGGSNVITQAFWCIFNGTWSANPRFDISAGVNTNVRMLVFRPTSGNTIFLDWGQVSADFAAPSTPFTVTITGIPRNNNSAVSIASWITDDDNTWGTLSGSGWSQTGLVAQYRNTSGSDMSGAFAYAITTSNGSAANVSLNQATLGGDPGVSTIIGFAEGINKNVTATVTALTFTKYNVTVATGGDRNVNATRTALTFATYNATVNKAKNVTATATAFTFATQNATVNKAKNANATVTALTFAKQNPTINKGKNATATLSAFTFTSYNPTVVKGYVVPATVTSFTFTKYNPTVSESRAITATSTAFTFTPRNASVNQARNAAATVTALTFTPRAASVGEARNANASVTAFTFTPYAPTVNEARGALATSASFTFTPLNPTVTEGADRPVSASVAAFTFATFKPTVAQGNDRVVPATSASFTFTPRAATIAKPLSLTASTVSFTFTPHATTVVKSYDVQVGVATFSFATHPATVPLSSIDVVIAATEAPDIVSIELESEGIAPPVQGPSGGGRVHIPRRLLLPDNEIVIRATEAPDVCRILLETDWAADDEEFLLLVMGTAA